MSGDIVERLRAPTDDDGDLLQDAADEIEWLRKKCADEKERADILRDAIRYAVEVKSKYTRIDAIIWLDDWFHGDTEAMRDRYGGKVNDEYK
jgi:hypothetical protein